jgi:hypothetical protein
MLRLIRLLHIRKVLGGLIESRVSSETVRLLGSIAQSMLAVVTVVHVIACCWAGLGRTSEQGWVAQRGLEEDPAEQYALSYHWTLSQFYGSIDLQPADLGERSFAIATLLLGFFTATAFTSSVTSSMTQLYMITSQQAAHFRVLRKYLEVHNISQALVSRVHLNAKRALAEEQLKVPESSVELLRLVSEPLREQLHAEVYGPTLSAHPFFNHIQEQCSHAIHQLCHTAISEMSFSQDDVLFSRGDISSCPKMLFVTGGELAYFSQEMSRPHRVMPGDWACEAALWTEWIHHGQLLAKSSCGLVGLGAQEFQEVMFQSHTTGLELKTYAVGFLKLINANYRTRSDLGTSIDVSSLVSAICLKGNGNGDSRSPSSSSSSGSRLPRLFPRRASVTQVQVVPSVASENEPESEEESAKEDGPDRSLGSSPNPSLQ